MKGNAMEQDANQKKNASPEKTDISSGNSFEALKGYSMWRQEP